MREIETILSAYDHAKTQGVECILATVVHVEGSSYRRAGARMLVDEYGVMTGAISGGCLEGDALRKALHALQQQRNKLVTYDTSDENDAAIGAQLGCNGVIQVLFEPIDFTDSLNPLELLRRAVKSEKESIVGTFFNLARNQDQTGTCLLIDEKSRVEGKKPEHQVLKQVLDDVEYVIGNYCSIFREYVWQGISQHLFLELFRPPVKLVLVGAGNDAQVLAEMAVILGWKVVVTDGRPSHANNERFGSTCQVVVSKPEQLLDNVSIHPQTFFVLMTHNYHYDLAVLKLLMEIEEIPYIGVLGPGKKFQKMLDELAGEGLAMTDEMLDKIHAPVGLEIGAETPAEIGLSILAEINAVLTGTTGLPLKLKDGPIHRKKNNEFKRVIIDGTE